MWQWKLIYMAGGMARELSILLKREQKYSGDSFLWSQTSSNPPAASNNTHLFPGGERKCFLALIYGDTPKRFCRLRLCLWENRIIMTCFLTKGRNQKKASPQPGRDQGQSLEGCKCENRTNTQEAKNLNCPKKGVLSYKDPSYGLKKKQCE